MTVCNTTRPTPVKTTPTQTQQAGQTQQTQQTQQVNNTQQTQTHHACPTLKQAAEDGKYLEQGHRGESVRHLQDMLKSRGYNIEVDGHFGPQTEAAIRDFQGKNNLKVDGLVGPQTLGAMGMPTGANIAEPQQDTVRRNNAQRSVGNDPALQAPAAGAPAPEGAVRAGELANADQARRVSSPVQTTGPADARLAQIQARAVDSARTELNNGVREQGGANRGPRIDQYARTNGMPSGNEWCGFFTGFNYTQAARESGTEFSGQMRLHSYEKARSYFMYRDYTNNSAGKIRENENLRTQHQADGSTRRFMTFQGSSGDRYANNNRLAHETYTNPRELPIRPGDTALFTHGHVGMVEGYDRERGLLTTIEGNVNNRVVRRTYDLNDPAVRARFDGFGRPAAGDFAPRA